jgi:hypothetical protein
MKDAHNLRPCPQQPVTLGAPAGIQAPPIALRSPAHILGGWRMCVKPHANLALVVLVDVQLSC